LNSGFMIPQYTAAALVSENKSKAHPASVDSIPTSANTEDHVSMGTIAARKTAEIVENVAAIIAIELLAAYQGLSFRLPLEPGVPIRAVTKAILAAGIERYTEDRVMYPDLAAMKTLMTTDAFLDLLE
jgi:histidine ammonia-lyase